MSDYPTSLLEFQQRFPDERACADYLIRTRWPDGFVCPSCGSAKAWALETKAFTFECADCHKQTSVTAGTIMHGSKLSLTIWFWAAYLMASHSNGISALQLQKQLGLGSYKSAWFLAAKLRLAMVAPGRSPLKGLVEADETTFPCRSKEGPLTGGGGRSAKGKLLIAGAVEVEDGQPGRIRLAEIKDFSATSLQGFLTDNLAKDATAKTDGWAAYPGAKDIKHEPHVVGPMAAHIVLPWIHRVFANFKTWALGVYHGLRRAHFKAYLNEFTFRFNRRGNRHAGFARLLAIGLGHKPVTYKMLIAPDAQA